MNRQPHHAHGSMTEEMLCDRLQALRFVLIEIGLYLDTHPKNKAALARMRRVQEEHDRLHHLYEEQFGPLTMHATPHADEWQYATQSFPWMMED